MDPSSPVRELAVEAQRAREEAGTPGTHAERLERLRLMRDLLARVVGAQGAKPDVVALGMFAAEWIELCPVTSANLAGAAVDLVSAQELTAQWLDLFARYLAALAKYAPTAPASVPRILRGIRRCSVTVGPDGLGVVRVRALTETDAFNTTLLNPLRRKAVHAVTGGRGGVVQIYRSQVPTMAPQRDPFKLVEQLGYTATLEFVPAAEQAAVSQEMLRMCCISDTGQDNKNMRGHVWAITITVPGGQADYELSVDASGKVRAERLGNTADRAPAALITARTPANAQTELATTFELSGVEAVGAAWQFDEIAFTAGAFSRIPPYGRRLLKGTAVIRGVQPPRPTGAGLFHMAAYHAGVSSVYDAVAPRNPPPHLHTYQPVFDHVYDRCCGAPGDSGRAVEWDLLHEVGHAVAMRLPSVAAQRWKADRDAALTAATDYQARLRAAYSSNASLRVAARPWVDALDSFQPVANVYVRSVEILCRDLEHGDVAAAATSGTGADAELRTLNTAVATLVDKAKILMASDNVPDELKLASTLTVNLVNAVREPVTRLVKLASLAVEFAEMARRLGFAPFTAYGATSPAEWMAETYALFCTDRQRLFEWNWAVCLWFETDCPDPTTYAPATPF